MGNATTTLNRQHDVSISATDKLKCVERELGYRYRVYPDLVAKGRMSQRTANREIKVMEEIAADLRAEAEKDRLL